MKYSSLFIKTEKNIPADAIVESHKLLLKSGSMMQLASGVYVFTPILWRVIRKIENIIRDVFDNEGLQEVYLAHLQPKSIWEQSGRWKTYTKIEKLMFTTEDRKGEVLGLGPTHEEVVTTLAKNIIDSYKDLPKMVYQIQTKFRDEMRPRFGLLRTREFIMMDAYSFDADTNGLDKTYKKIHDAYVKIFRRCGLETRVVEADTGAIGGSESHEFMVLAKNGEDTILHCPNCGYAANIEKASFAREEDQELAIKDGIKNYFTENPSGDFAKIKFFLSKTSSGKEELVVAIIKNTLEVNETKLAANAAAYLEPLTDEKAATLIVTKKFHLIARDISVDDKTKIYVPENLRKNFEEVIRDNQVLAGIDIATAKAGMLCPNCKKALAEAKGIEAGHIFKLGTKYSAKLDCTYKDARGKEMPSVMGCYGLGISRMVAAAIEQSNDEYGIIWPKEIAPFKILLIGLNLEDENVKNAAEKIHDELINAGVEVLYDDRENMRAGEKFNDADLLGIPFKVIISKKALENNSFEVKNRKTGETTNVSLENIESLKSL